MQCYATIMVFIRRRMRDLEDFRLLCAQAIRLSAAPHLRKLDARRMGCFSAIIANELLLIAKFEFSPMVLSQESDAKKI